MGTTQSKKITVAPADMDSSELTGSGSFSTYSVKEDDDDDDLGSESSHYQMRFINVDGIFSKQEIARNEKVFAKTHFFKKVTEEKGQDPEPQPETEASLRK